MGVCLPKAALDQHVAILGKTGSGKSYCAKGIVEHLMDEKRQVCILIYGYGGLVDASK